MTTRYMGLNGTDACTYLGIDPDSVGSAQLSIRVPVDEETLMLLESFSLDDEASVASRLSKAYGSRDLALAYVKQALE